VEASAIRAGPRLGQARLGIGTPLLRLRSDQQLVALFRAGNDEAFRIIHDRYRPRLLAYVRQMLPGRVADAEDALQDVFMRTYEGLRTSNGNLALRPWLYRVAHNRCVDELRRPAPSELSDPRGRHIDGDPAVQVEQRELLRRLVMDIGRLPEQQRSALLMRELSGMPYADVANALDVSVPAVKSLLVRARMGLTQAVEARDAACADICEDLAEAHDRGARASWMARRHLRDCPCCRAFHAQLRTSRRQFAALAPTLGPLALLAKLLGVGAGGGTATAASAGGGAAGAASGAAGITVGHVATVLAAAVVTAGGAVELQHTVVAPAAAKPAQHVIHQTAPPSQTGAAPTAGQAKSSVAYPVPSATTSQAVRRRTAAAIAPSTPGPASAVTQKPAAGGVPRWHLGQDSATQSTDSSATQGTGAGPTVCATSTTDCPADSTSTQSGTTQGTTTGSTGSTSTTPPPSGGTQSTSGTGSAQTGTPS